MASYLKDFEKQPPQRQFLPPFIEESFQREQQQQQTMAVTMSDMGTETDSLKKKKRQTAVRTKQLEENLFWISVSGYHMEHMGLVYRFLADIGNVIDKILTESNFMYLKYASIMDCEIALSYDGQKIGYAGDILVHVRPENPMFDYKLQTVIEEEEEEELEQEVAKVIDQSVSICVIEVERPQQVQLASDDTSSIVPIGSITPLKPRVVRKTGFLQWLKQKVSYMFYYY